KTIFSLTDEQILIRETINGRVPGSKSECLREWEEFKHEQRQEQIETVMYGLKNTSHASLTDTQSANATDRSNLSEFTPEEEISVLLPDLDRFDKTLAIIDMKYCSAEKRRKKHGRAIHWRNFIVEHGAMARKRVNVFDKNERDC